jgi:hypothetical protein
MGHCNVIPEFRVSEISGTQRRDAWLYAAPGSRLSAHERSGRDDRFGRPA